MTDKSKLTGRSDLLNKVIIHQDSDPLKPVISIRSEGHADARTCAAVSAIMQTTILGLKAIADEYPEQVKVTEHAKSNAGETSP